MSNYSFLRHLKEKIEIIYLYIFINLIFIFVFKIFDVKLFPMIYANIISLFILSIYLTYDYLKKINFDYKKEKLSYRENIILREYEEILKKYEELNYKYINLDSSIKNFYTLWIHEIKTPIAANELLLNENKIDYNKIRINNKKIEEYVNLLLHYIRDNSIDNDYKFEKIYLDNIIKKAIKQFSINFIAKNIKLDYKNSNVKIVSDEKWLLFIISQVLSNSLKYTKEFGEIKIYFKEDVLYICDNGIGIKREDINRVFEEGYTGYSGRIYEKSTGLGLYLVKSCADKLNLKINIKSRENIGTIFSIKFKNVTYL